MLHLTSRTLLTAVTVILTLELSWRSVGSRSLSRRRHHNRPVSSFSSSLYGGRWHTAAPLIYGYSFYMLHSGHRHPDSQPTICTNVYDLPLRSDNATTTTTTGNSSVTEAITAADPYYEWFICPNITESYTYNYCCGPDDRQTCCRYWDDAGRVAGVVVAIVVFIAFCVIIFVVVHRKQKQWRTGSSSPSAINSLRAGSLLSRSNYS